MFDHLDNKDIIFNIKLWKKDLMKMREAGMIESGLKYFTDTFLAPLIEEAKRRGISETDYA